ncbi:hypothetical protein ANCDUO_05158 [Ancylostoma duodenale]|uniref:Uncharacterized protein n=1 Tax=Ancylostoma duodenale TaxID=51022 RepID=A0A0C2H564_9BILA|nr:hypothetical protein ANCDUO_05158 [Ancylostoma duodenale]
MSMSDRSATSPDILQAMPDLDSMHLSDYSAMMSLLRPISLKLDDVIPRVQRLEAILPRMESLDNVGPEIQQLRLDNELLLQHTGTIMVHTAPKSKSNCVFCSVEENRDPHYSSRCCKFADPVTRTVQASKLGLCLKCLKPSHGDDCKVACAGCGLGHNQLLCNSKRPHANANNNKRPRN